MEKIHERKRQGKKEKREEVEMIGLFRCGTKERKGEQDMEYKVTLENAGRKKKEKTM